MERLHLKSPKEKIIRLAKNSSPRCPLENFIPLCMLMWIGISLLWLVFNNRFYTLHFIQLIYLYNSVKVCLPRNNVTTVTYGWLFIFSSALKPPQQRNSNITTIYVFLCYRKTMTLTSLLITVRTRWNWHRAHWALVLLSTARLEPVVQCQLPEIDL